MDPEGVKIEGLEIVQEIGLRKNERRAAQSTVGADIGDQLPEGGRQARPAVLDVIIAENRTTLDAQPDVLEIGLLENKVLKVPPEPVAQRLVEAVMLGSNVREVKGIPVCLARFRHCPPAEVRPTRDVAAIKAIISINFLAELK